MREIKKFDIFRHFKGGIYVILDISDGYNEDNLFTNSKISEPASDIAFSSDDCQKEIDLRCCDTENGKKYFLTEPIFDSNKKYVIYKDLYNNIIWVRELEEFLSEVDSEKYPYVAQKYRFEKLN